ncbi:hypothetical protein GCM10009603_09860 [Nocardiopsis exhalans]|uniref:hypothetical protein n=1 Tax=Nocardiopsis exhalans TaxID=163604 RepID=UPI0031E16125
MWPCVRCFHNLPLLRDLATRGEFGAELASGSKITAGERAGIGPETFHLLVLGGTALVASVAAVRLFRWE